MTDNRLRLLRETVPYTQKAFASEMGLALRTLENIEAGRVETRMVHINAARFALTHLAAQDVMAAKHIPKDIADVILRAARNIEAAKQPEQK